MPVNQQISVTVDAVVFGVENGKRSHLLLIQRKNGPYQSQWAFPGGFVEKNEDLPVACARELEEETGLKVAATDLSQVGAFGKPGRDPRGRTITIAFKVEIEGLPEVKGADDASRAQWWALSDLPELAFDHKQVLQVAY